MEVENRLLKDNFAFQPGGKVHFHVDSERRKPLTTLDLAKVCSASMGCDRWNPILSMSPSQSDNRDDAQSRSGHCLMAQIGADTWTHLDVLVLSFAGGQL